MLVALRRPERWPALERSLYSGGIWLSSVVVAELYAGTRSPGDALILNRITAAMDRVGRLLTPEAGDWARAGRLLARRIRLSGDLRPRDHLADILILLSAARLGGVVITLNLGHFLDWARLANAAGLDVMVRAPDAPG